jgi:hypothetical protein
MFMGMGIDPENDAMLHALLQPFGRFSKRLLHGAIILIPHRST